MPFDEMLVRRIESVMPDSSGLEPKSMFGGIGYLVHGNMACGVYKEFLIVRVGLERYEQVLSNPQTRVFDITGKVMKGWVMVDSQTLSEQDLANWIEMGMEFASGLPKK